MRKYFIILFLFFLIITSKDVSAFAQIDSLEQILKSSKDKKRIQILNELSELNIFSFPAKTVEYGKQAYKLSMKFNDEKSKSQSLINIASGYNRLGDIEKGNEYFDKSLKLGEFVDDDEIIGNTYFKMGHLSLELGDFKNGLQYFLNAMSSFEKINNKIKFAYVMLDIGALFLELKDFEKSIDYTKKAIEIFEENKERKGLLLSYLKLGLINHRLFRFETSLEYYKKAGKYAISTDPLNLILIYRFTSACLIDSGRYDIALILLDSALRLCKEKGFIPLTGDILTLIGHCYYLQGDFEKDLEYNIKALRVRKEIGIKIYYGSSLINIGGLYLKLKNYDKALDYLTQGLKIAQETEMQIYILKSYQELSELYFQQKNFKKALEYQHYVVAISDSIIAEKSNRNILEIIEFSEKIQQKDNEIKEAEQNKYRLLFISLVVLLILSSIMWVLYRQKKKTDELMLKIEVSEKRYKLLFDILPYGGEVLSLDGYIVNCSKSTSLMLGYEIDEIIGKHLTEFFDTDSHIIFKEKNLSIRNGNPESAEIKMKKKDGSLIDIFRSASPIFDNDGNVVEILALSMDITERKEAEAEIHKLNEELEQKVIERTAKLNDTLEELRIEMDNRTEIQKELEELNSTKDKFFTIIAHDLKNPLQGLLTSIDVLKQMIKSNDFDKVIKFLGYIDKSSKKLNDLLENLLTWSRSQRNKIDFEPEKFDIESILIIIKDLYKESIAQKHISIDITVEEKTMIYADKNMISTVLRNILSNAIKFTEPYGEIEISCIEIDGMFEFAVKDSGIGISKENINKLFRIDIHNTEIGTSKEKGTGLGLILCKEFIEKHKGKIRVESEFGKGSKFIITLPNS